MATDRFTYERSNGGLGKLGETKLWLASTSQQVNEAHNLALTMRAIQFGWGHCGENLSNHRHGRHRRGARAGQLFSVIRLRFVHSVSESRGLVLDAREAHRIGSERCCGIRIALQLSQQERGREVIGKIQARSLSHTGS